MLNITIKKKNCLLFVLFFCVFILISILTILEINIPERVIIPFYISFFIFCSIFILLNKLFKDKFISKIYLVSGLLHFIVILFWEIFKIYLLGYPMPTDNIFIPFTVDNDGVLYHEIGVYISNNFSLQLLQEKFIGGLFPKIIGVLYYITKFLGGG